MGASKLLGGVHSGRGPKLMGRTLASLAALAAASLPGLALAQDAPRIRALLVGAVSYSPAVGGPLVGAGNDAWLMAETLTARGAKAADITVLSDAAPRGRFTVAGRPDLATIRRALRELAENAREGEQVVVLFSGHGMQQPERVAGNEPDGLDEVFLPLDASLIDGAMAAGIPLLRGTLSDDDIGEALAAIRAKGADVLFLADFCHSGDSTRGQKPGARVADMKLRADAMDAPGAGLTRKGRYIGFFASPSPVQAQQNIVPWWLDSEVDESDPTRYTQGVLTGYTALALRDQGLTTWLDVARRVESYVVQHNGRMDPAPPPQFEGDLAAPVFGSQAAGKGRSWSVVKAATFDDIAPPLERLVMNAGALDGIREGALMSLSLTDDKGVEKVMLHAKASEVVATRMVLLPADGPRTPASAWRSPKDAEGEPLTAEARFIVRMVRQGRDLGYRVFVSPPSDKANPRLTRAMRSLSLADLGVTKATSARDADLEVRVEGGKLVFASTGAPDGKGFGSLSLTDLPATPQGLSLRLRASIASAARFHRLRGVLTEMGPSGAAGTNEAPVRPKVEMFLWRAAGQAAEGAACPVPEGFAAGEPIPADAVPFERLGVSEADVPALRRCDIVLARITNTETGPIDLTALVMKPDGTIEPLETQADGRVRLEPGRVGTLGYELSADAGAEQVRDDLMMIAVRVPVGESGPEGVASDFTFLCQPGVTAAGSLQAVSFVETTGCGADRRRRSAETRSATETALGDLFEAAASGDTRGADSAQTVGQTAILRFSWMQDAAAPVLAPVPEGAGDDGR